VERCVNSVTQEDGSNCSIFSFDVTANKARLPMARNAVKKLRTLRHPGVIRVLDTVEVWALEGAMTKKSY
jgi:SCY1-like protein 1